MKITRKQLRHLILQETRHALHEQGQPEGEPDPRQVPGNHGVADADINWDHISSWMKKNGGLLLGMDITIPGRIYAFKRGEVSDGKRKALRALIRQDGSAREPGKSANDLGLQFRVETNESNTDARLGRRGTDYKLAGDVELVVVAYGAAPG